MASSPDPQSLFTFKNGDVRIVVTHNGQRVVGKVSSHAMALVSPAWENFIYDPRNTPSKQVFSNAAANNASRQDNLRAPAAEVDFSEDNSEALLILLRIAHLHFAEIPTVMNYEELLNLAVLCNQYLCIGIVKPWIRLWLQDEGTQSILEGQENWLFIAWTFGRESVFKSLARKMVKEVTTNEDGRCLISNSNEISEPMPPGIIERILEVRNETIGKLLSIPYSKIEKYDASIDTLCSASPDDPKESSACDAIIYGSYTRGLQKIGLWPRKNIEDIHISIQELASMLSSIEIYQYAVHNSYGYGYEDKHTCSPGDIKKEVSSQLKNIADPVLESHRRHMAAQN
ncbi:hypothetical protein N431DRAFT_377959 [Stipitochalara longipes BDJ]|nr:hypothetical protein N431DRAFT_377959 [Stipitochalara longipes BDJ]